MDYCIWGVYPYLNDAQIIKSPLKQGYCGFVAIIQVWVNFMCFACIYRRGLRKPVDCWVGVVIVL